VTSADAFSVSVVIPLFNKEAALGTSIGSVLRQTRLPDELIVVDDGSTDGSRERCQVILADAKPSFPWRIVDQPNGGVSIARNRGADEARGRFIAFLDADDEWLPEHLEEIEALADAYPSASVLTTFSVPTEGTAPVAAVKREGRREMLERPLARYRVGNGLLNSSSVAIRRNAWDKAGGFPPGATSGEDVYLWLKLALTETFARSSAPLVLIHREHAATEQRVGRVGHYLTYFLDTPEGRAELCNPDLAAFLGSTLAGNIAWRRLKGNRAVVRELRRLAAPLPLASRMACVAAAFAPLWSLRAAKSLKAMVTDDGNRVPRPGS
jgi:glycosyltransferase involved in cell wall biosynthesis